MAPVRSVPPARPAAARFLVRFDPGRRGARAPEHAIGHRPFPCRRIILEGQALALVRQVVERALLHRLADLALDEALPGRRRLGRPSASRRCGLMPRSYRSPRQARCHGPLLRFGRNVSIDGKLVDTATDLVGFLACDHLSTLERAARRGSWSARSREDPDRPVIAGRGVLTRLAYLAATSRAAGRDRRDRDRGISTTPDRAAGGGGGDARRRCGQASTSSTRPRSSTAGGAATPTSSSGSSARADPRRLVLRGRRRQARPPREGRRHPPDVRLLRAARTAPGRRTGAHPRHHRRRREHAPPTRRLPRLLPRRSRRATKTRSSADRRRAAPHLPRRSTTAASAAGSTCIDQRRADDHLSLVAGMRRDQTRELWPTACCHAPPRSAVAAASRTSTAWATRSLERLRHQARLQVVEARGTAAVFELLDRRNPTMPGRGLALAARAVARRPVLRHGGDPYALDGGPRVPVRRRRPRPGRAAYPRFWAHDRAEREGRASSSSIDFVDRAARCRTPTCTSTTTALRADRAQAADGRHGDARGGGRRAAARRRVRRPLRGRAPGRAHRSSRTRSRGRAALHARPRGRGDGRRRQHRRLRALAARRTTSRCSTRSSAYNTDDCRSTLCSATGSRSAATRPTPTVRARRSRAAAVRRRAARSARRPRRPTSERVPTLSWPGCRPTRDGRTPSTRPAGCSPTSWTGTAARRSPSGGPTSTVATRAHDDFTDDRECIGGLELVGEVEARQEVDGLPVPVRRRRTTSSRSAKPFDPRDGTARRPARSSRSTTRRHARPQARRERDVAVTRGR